MNCSYTLYVVSEMVRCAIAFSKWAEAIEKMKHCHNYNVRKITVAHIVLGLHVGGLEMVVANLIKATDAKRFRAVVCCLEARGALASLVEAFGGRVIALKNGMNAKTYSLPFRLAQILKRERVQVVHAHNLGPYLHGLIAAKLASCPVFIYTMHGQTSFPVNWRQGLIGKMALPFTDKMVAVSDDVRRLALSRENVPPEKVLTIINGIDVDLYAPQNKREEMRKVIGVSDKEFVIGNVARLAPIKDHGNLLEAFALILQQREDVKLVIVGDGPSRTELEQRAERLNLGHHVSFLGERHDVPELLQAFDIFVLSSISEGISLTLLEAMAASLPIVATNVGGNPEIILPDKTGLLVPPRDPKSLSDAIIKILSGKEIKKMGELARQHICRSFSLRQMANQYEELYEYFLRHKGIK